MKKVQKIGNRAILSVLGLLTSAILSGTEVNAEDGKVFAGLNCVELKYPGAESHVSYGSGEIRNEASTGAVVVECPVTKDDINGDITSAHLRVYKASNAGVLTSLHSKSAYGTSGYVQYQNEWNGTGYKGISFSPLSGYGYGFYYFSVVLPSSTDSEKSRVISYRVTED